MIVGELTTEIGEILTKESLFGDKVKVWGGNGGLVFFSELHAPVFPGLVLASWVVEEDGRGRHNGGDQKS